MIKAKKNYSTGEIAKIVNVAYFTVARWIDDGKLEAFRTPGGHRRVYANILVDFLKKHRMQIPSEFKIQEKKIILVVDDDERVLRHIIRFLKKNMKEFDVIGAGDGYQAGQAVSDHNPVLVILDIMLPGIDGFDVCRNIKSRDRNIKVIAITGYDTPENKRKILEAGADVYIPKPFEMKEILENVINAISKKQDKMKIIDVNSGELKTAKRDVELRSLALGSCIAVAAYDAASRMGGIAHIMLPGKSTDRNKKNRRKYAVDAIDELIEKMVSFGAKRSAIKVSIAGGGNVLKKKDDAICENNIRSVIECLIKKRLEIIGSSVGGTERRSISLDIKTGKVLFTKGNSVQKALRKTDLSKYYREK